MSPPTPEPTAAIPEHVSPVDPREKNPAWSPVVRDMLRSALVYAECHEAHPRTTYHRQAGIELHLTVEGRAHFGVGSRDYPQTPRQGLVFLGSVPHQYISDPAFGFRRNIACFQPERLPVAGAPGGLFSFDWLGPERCFPYRLTESDFTRVDDLWRRLRLESHLNVLGAAEMCTALLMEILVIVRRSPADRLGVTGAPGFGRQRGDLVQFASSYVQNHLVDDLSLTAVAAVFRTSPEHLTRSFRRQLGVSFHQHVLQQRVAAAKDRLRMQRTASVTDIAFATGFQSSSHFNRVFKAHTGTTPTDYRNGVD